MPARTAWCWTQRHGWSRPTADLLARATAASPRSIRDVDPMCGRGTAESVGLRGFAAK